MIEFIKYTPVVACIGVAAILAVRGNDRWGWFLLAAVAITSAVTS